ncbi:O-Methyltransferase involved in polyketide biosynthesis [Methanosarcina barkeri 3]|uniref:O-Methyltransferase involved in polyketide biosynthesis n=2 Tax=Methanosarcina barkeri TaxID=2208 RepID=A0A0E3WVK3_METBA|nr:O-Methyltransferase involved in polyketide biosynthesis [Methanosarcina barkeri 3]
MKEDKASLSAIMTACIRAHHSMYDTPKIFDDFLAYNLIPQEALLSIKQHFSKDKQFNDPEHTVTPSDQTITLSSVTKSTSVLSRARYTEDVLEEAVIQGVKQYVILGAGLDTFAFRRPEMMDCLEVFEVDHPATQNLKLHRLAELGWEHPAHLHFIPVDFTKENLATALIRSPYYDPSVKSFFSWLGVTMYLTREEVFSTLRSITDIAPEGSAVIFDYFDSDAFIPEKSSPIMKKKQEIFQKLGEKIITGFNPLTLDEDITSLGLSLHEDLSPEDIEKHYFQGRKDGHHAPEHGHIAWTIVK